MRTVSRVPFFKLMFHIPNFISGIFHVPKISLREPYNSIISTLSMKARCVYKGSPSERISDVYTLPTPRRQRAAQATTIAPRWQTLWRQHGPFGGTLARIFWPADLTRTADPNVGSNGRSSCRSVRVSADRLTWVSSNPPDGLRLLVLRLNWQLHIKGLL